jgi:uncharacterized OB-fold protein
MSAAGYQKFLPEDIPDWQMPFWDSLKRRQAAVQRCERCGVFRYIPKERCPACLSPDSTWTEISGRGRIYTYTVVHRAPTPAYQADAPYVIAHVAMEEGFRMVGNVTGIAPEAVEIGMDVHLAYFDATPRWTLFAFQADE